MEYSLCTKLNALPVKKNYVGQTKKRLKERFIQHRNVYLKPDIYQSYLVLYTHVKTCLLYTSRCV